MRKEKRYDNTRFPAWVIEEAHDVFLSHLDSNREIGKPVQLIVRVGSETWAFDSREEFLAIYPESDEYTFDHIAQGNRFFVVDHGSNGVLVFVELPKRPLIESVLQVFEANAEKSMLVPPPGYPLAGPLDGILSLTADVTNLDNEIRARCLPILDAGNANPKLWDSIVRTATVVLEERLRDIGGITDPSRVGQGLVNDVFGQHGTLAERFTVDSERQGYRDLYAGVVGAFRNPYGHRFVDPAPEDGGAFLVFVNLLLKMLEDLR